MEFLVDMVTTVPDGTTEEGVAGDARAGGRALTGAGGARKLAAPVAPAPRARRVALRGACSARPTEQELETVLASMPLRAWRKDTVTPLTAHPNDPAAQAQG